MASAQHPSPFARLWTLLRTERRELGVVVLYAVGIGVFNLAAPLTAMAVVNSVALASLPQQFIVMSAAMLGALGFSAVLQILQTVVVEYMQRRVFVRVAADLADRLPRVDVSAFDNRHGPELVNRFFDVLTVQKAGATLLLDGVSIALQVAIGLLLLGFYDPVLLGFDLVLVAALAFIVFVLGRGAVHSAIDESYAKYAVAGWLEEVARHPVAFKTAGGPGLAQARAEELLLAYLAARGTHFRRVMRQFGSALFLQATASASLLLVGGYLVIHENISLGQLVAAEIVVALVVASFSKLGKQLESYYDLLAAADKLGHLTDLPTERRGGLLPDANPGGMAVVARGVSYTYPGSVRPALVEFHLELRPGERVAIRGPNGSGKSTFLDLLFGLRRPDAGRIELDGHDLRDRDLIATRSEIAIVKGLELIEGTIFDNVCMGRPSVSLADVRQALESLSLLEPLLDFPDGLNTNLVPGGAPLSLGQANRLMLARAIAGRPRLLVLDEVLGHIDDDAREVVLATLFDRAAGWTLLIVTHRTDVPALCDRTLRIGAPHADRP